MCDKCILLSSEIFESEMKISFDKDTLLILAMIFIPDIYTFKHVTKDQEAKIIIDGWEYFRESFSFSCAVSRTGWRRYFMFLCKQHQTTRVKFRDVIDSFRDSMDNTNEFWRIAFSIREKDIRIKDFNLYSREFESLAVHAARDSPSTRIFSIDISNKKWKRV